MSSIIFDSFGFGYRTMWAKGRGNLEHENVPTGVTYGFLMDILYTAQRFSTNKFVFCWDSRTSKRKELFPGYKNRKHDEDTPEDAAKRKAMHVQLDLLRDSILPDIGFKNNLYAEGLEADDHMAQLVREWLDDWIMATTDNDMYQTLDNCSIWRYDQKKMVTRQSFIDQYGIQPRQWADFKSIAGCTSDTVPGVPGMGEKYTLDFLKGDLGPGKRLDSVTKKKGRKLIKFYKKLVKLPFKGTPSIELLEDDFDYEALKHWCHKFNLQSILEDDRWMMFMKPGLIY